MVRQKFKPFQKAKDAKEFWDNAEEPQEGLVPLFNSPFYATPDEPADPMDCNRYPDSPYCGGFPFSKEPLSLEINLVKDDCNLGLQVSGVLGFIKTPAFQIVYRNPACISEPPPPIPKPFNTTIEVPEPTCPNGIWLSLKTSLSITEEGSGSVGYSSDQYSVQIVSIEYPYLGDEKIYRFTTDGYVPTIPLMHIVLNNTYQYRLNSRFLYNHNFLEETYIDYWRRRGGVINGNPLDHDTIWTLNKTLGTNLYLENFGSRTVFHEFPFEEGEELVGNFVSVINYDNLLQAGGFTSSTRGVTGDDNYAFGITTTDTQYELIEVCGNYTRPPTNPPPPNNMSCCPNVEQNDQLLKLILKKIGSTQLPATVPKVLTNRQKGTIKIESLAEFTAYTVKQLDAVCGRYPIDIEIEDSDLTKEGNQTKKLKLPNIAETLAEMMGMLLVLRSESDATLNATIRALTEAGSAKQMAFMAYEYAKANAEFLGYKGEQKERKIPFAFKPGEARLDKMLVEGEMSVKGWENEDKDDFNDLIAPLLELKDKYQLKGQISFRLANKKAETITDTDVLTLAQNIKAKFATPPFIWKKGKLLISYSDWEKGYQFQLLVSSKTEAKRIIEQVLNLQNHSPQWEFMNLVTNEVPETTFDETPKKKMILGKQEEQPTKRREGNVHFQYAQLFLCGREKPIILCDISHRWRDPIVKVEPEKK